MTDITVKLDINGDPAVTCTPPGFTANRGNQEIKWNKAGSNKKDFNFHSLSGLPKPTFTLPPTYDGDKWVVPDNDTQAADYPYVLQVKTPADGKIYSTKPTKSAVTGGGPTIKNT